MEHDLHRCTKCGLDIRIPASARGRVGACPACGTAIVIGAPSPPPPQARPAPPRPVAASPARRAAPAPPSRPRRAAQARRRAGSYGRRRTQATNVGGGIALAVLLAIFVYLRATRDGGSEPGPTFGTPGRSATSSPAASQGTRDLDVDALLTAAPPPGTRVKLRAALCTLTLVKLSGTGPEEYFALALPRDSDLFQRISRLRARAEQLVTREIPALRRVGVDGSGSKEILDRIDSFYEDLEVLLRIRDDDRAVAISLSRFGSIAANGEWEEILRAWERPKRPLSDQLGDLFGGRAEEYRSPLEGMDRNLRALEDDRPPDLSKRLPFIEDARPDGTDPDEVDAYNRLVDRYNRELARRQEYLVQSLQEDLLHMQSTLHRALVQTERDLDVVVLDVGRDVSFSFAKAAAFRPPLAVREDPPPGRAFVEVGYATVDLLVTSYPTGARVLLDGAVRGTTPLLLTDQPAGRRVDVRLELDGYRPSTATVTTDPVAIGPVPVDRVLAPR